MTALELLFAAAGGLSVGLLVRERQDELIAIVGTCVFIGLMFLFGLWLVG